MKDFFRPRNNPVQIIYDAFQKEAEKRNKRSVEEWTVNERQAVFEAAKNYAKKNELIIPTMEEIERAENYAYGSADYGAKWAYRISDFMQGGR